MHTSTTKLHHYELAVHPLDKAPRTLTYHLTNDFLHLFPERLVENCLLTATVELYPAYPTFKLHIFIEGSIELICDRTLQPFQHPISIEETLVCKWGEEEELLDEKTYVISSQKGAINLALHFYDFIHLAIPMQAIAP